MDDDAVLDAIKFMWLNYDQELTLDRLASHAMYSKFYFLRRFKSATGVTPGRFLTAIRLARSKQILAHDQSISITDLSLAVGYDSMGAFSTKFHQVVGMTPSEYRTLHREERPDIVSSWAEQYKRLTLPARTGKPLVAGTVEPPADATRDALTYIGVFARDIATGRPVACTVLPADQREFAVHGAAPAGEWRVHAVTLDPEAAEPTATATATVPRAPRAQVEEDPRTAAANDVTLRMAGVGGTSLPILTALPELHSRAVVSGSLEHEAAPPSGYRAMQEKRRVVAAVHA
ncbi:helix-turn-helix transcriptional regulator [Phycicoccus sp. CSK15P-2]|uniref:helix-turn-helix transcriptional regulator n=1 Tax=Phycicoccus sp. CSK15P-2 TaxID=2807627 RepID=UPI00194EA77E|nr:helix-turn-helix transcriptional regulator [Phycicoccus sp. CSK15P-2]MBM6405594.1 helix-turn-helix transcriptional regulator [Phycicoccus sp. CSK15P-2]